MSESLRNEKDEQLRPKEDLKGLIKEFYGKFHVDKIITLLKNPDQNFIAILHIDLTILVDFNILLFDQLVKNPLSVISEFESSLLEYQKQIIDENAESKENFVFKRNRKMRFVNFPITLSHDIHKIPIFFKNPKLVIVSANVLRVSDKKVLKYERCLKCKKCGHVFSQQTAEDQFNIFSKPKICPGDSCKSSNFATIESHSSENSIDYQEIRIQESLNKLGIKRIPKSIDVSLHGDLVDFVQPGDQIILIGILTSRWRTLINEQECELEVYIQANSIEKQHKNFSSGTTDIDNQDQSEPIIAVDESINYFRQYWAQFKNYPYTARDKIVSSICPKLFGMYPLKMAYLLQIIGGCQVSEEGSRIRGDIHMLLVGDPGVGKSQFLQFTLELFPYAIMTTGLGSSNAGLTAAASRDGGDWHLEAGALVMADGCICCIDEFNSIKEVDKGAIHEAMEQQKVSVAKAGIVCKLNARCSILAATNPKGGYDYEQPLNVNIAMASPLLSRFDLIMLLLDRNNEEWDCKITEHLLSPGLDKIDADNVSNESNDNSIIEWKINDLQRYIQCIKKLKPTITEEAKALISSYYAFQRSNDQKNSVRTTIRFLESIIRLSTAHARLMFKENVEINDVIEAIFVIEYSLRGCGIFPDRINVTQIDTPNDSEKAFEERKSKILETLKHFGNE